MANVKFSSARVGKKLAFYCLVEVLVWIVPYSLDATGRNVLNLVLRAVRQQLLSEQVLLLDLLAFESFGAGLRLCLSGGRVVCKLEVGGQKSL